MFDNLQQAYESMGISKTVYELSRTIENSLKERFEEIDRITECNQLKVLHAMQVAARVREGT